MDFEKVYKTYKWLIEVNATKFSKTSGEDVDDLKSLLNTEMWLIYQNYDKDKGPLETFLNISLQGKLINYIKGKNNEFNRETTPFSYYEEEGEDGSEVSFEVESDYVLINHVLERNGELKTDEDKRQLIFALTSKADPMTTAIVKEFLADVNIKPTAIGRKLGIHHQVVRRKLDSLARNYSERKHGSINEYLAV